jgi:phage recombination protein Bet
MGEVTVRNFSDTELSLLKSTIVPSDATDDEIKLFIMICKKYNLDPFSKEIVMTKYQTKDGYRTNFITTRDGYLKIAMQDPGFDGIISFVVKEGDEFEIDAGSLQVKHKFGSKRGEIIGAWAMARHKNRPPVIVFVDFKEYVQNTPVWRQYPSAMIQKVAEVSALRRQFNISGLVAREEIGEVEIEHKIVEEKKSHSEDQSGKTMASEKQLKLLYALINEFARVTDSPRDEIINEIKERYGINSSKELTRGEASEIIDELQARIYEINSGRV